jgi:hypothetical protein
MLMRMWEKRNPHTLLVGMYLVQLLCKPIWRFLKKLKIDLPYDATMPFLGIYLKECKSIYKRDTCTPMVIVALLTIAKLWKQLKCPTTNKRIKM